MPRKYGWAKKRDNPPEGYDYVKPTLQALENELRAAIADDGLYVGDGGRTLICDE